MLTNKKILLPVLSLALLCPTQFLQAQAVTLEPSKDNSVFSEADDSNGQGSYLFAGRTNQGPLRRALLQFDLSGSIPQGAVIESVSLSLQMNKTRVGAATISAHRLTADWGEGASDASANEGRGTPAATGDATWNHTFYPSSFWSSAGGDFSGTSSASQSVSGIGSYTWSGSGMVADVQDWVDNPSQNFGWILIGPESATSAKRFDSGEATNAANRPQLNITYSLPPAGWAGFTIEEDGRSVDTGGWIGIVDIANAPWIYNYPLDTYLYAPEENINESGSWLWVSK